MGYERGEAKPLSGKTFPVKLSKEMNYEKVYETSMKKWEDYDRTFLVITFYHIFITFFSWSHFLVITFSRDYILVYPDGKI